MIRVTLGKATVAAATRVVFEGGGLRATVSFYEGVTPVLPGVERPVMVTPEIQALHKQLVELIEIEVCKEVGAVVQEERATPSPADATPASPHLPPALLSPLEQKSPGGDVVDSINDFLEGNS